MSRVKAAPAHATWWIEALCAVVVTGSSFIALSLAHSHTHWAGLLLKPLPALSLSLVCAAHSNAPTALAMLTFALGDVLLEVSDVFLARAGSALALASYAGIFVFIAGQCAMLRHLSRTFPASALRTRVFAGYAALGAAIAVAVVAVVRTPLAMSGAPLAVLLSAVCGVSVAGLAGTPSESRGRALLVAVGAHLYIAGDALCGLHMIFGWPASDTAYVLMEMPLYYMAITCEAIGALGLGLDAHKKRTILDMLGQMLRRRGTPADTAVPLKQMSSGSSSASTAGEKDRQQVSTAEKPRASTITVSLLDGDLSRMPVLMGLVLGATWALDSILDAAIKGRLAEEFAPLAGWLHRLPLVVVLNAVGGCFSTFAWFLIAAGNRGLLGRRASALLYGACQLVLLLAPAAMLAWIHPQYSPVLGAALLMHHAVFIMKSHSYYFLCRDDKTAACGLREYAMYIMFPTLVYHPRCEYERTKKVRWSFVASHAVAGFVSFLVLYQIMRNLVGPILMQYASSEVNFWRLWMHLMVPAFCMFLTAFYGVFHCLLNIISELLLYSDRDFYRDWWHSTDMGEWTRKWNSTVQNWIAAQYIFMRHELGLPRGLATFLAIFLSGCWHDFILAFMFHQLTLWTMMFMSLQVILITLARTSIGVKVNNKCGSLLVLMMLPTGFGLLIAAWGSCYFGCPKAVCLPHELIKTMLP
eukprot:m51a1_g5965 hypothetical protein (697) ;mRNA; f:173886-176609